MEAKVGNLICNKCITQDVIRYENYYNFGSCSICGQCNVANDIKLYKILKTVDTRRLFNRLEIALMILCLFAWLFTMYS